MSVPVPLLLPVLVDEVLLEESGPVLPVMDQVLPEPGSSRWCISG